MIEPLNRRVAEFVDMGWEPQATTDTSASLTTRGPFQWWLFVFVVILFPLLGGVLYVAFWLATSRVVVFLHQQDGEVTTSGGTRTLEYQQTQQAAARDQQRQIRERGFWPVMWPKMLVMFAFLVLWLIILVRIF